MITNHLESFRKYHGLISALVPEYRQLLPREIHPAQLPLLIYLQFLELKRNFERMPAKEFSQQEEHLRVELERLESSSDWEQRSSVGALTALAMYAGGMAFSRDASIELAQHAFGRLVHNQLESGRWFALDTSANPESAWFDELATLHAAASYAVRAEDRHVATAVKRSSDFIAAEIQPDHATTQPWGLFAFIWNEATQPVADQLLHAVELRRNDLDAVSLILLRDSLYCLELFL